MTNELKVSVDLMQPTAFIQLGISCGILLWGILIVAWPPPIFQQVPPLNAASYFGAFAGFTGVMSVFFALFFNDLLVRLNKKLDKPRMKP